MARQAPVSAAPVRAGRGGGAILIVLALLGAGVVGAGSAYVTFEVQAALLILSFIVIGAIWFIPRAVRREPSVTVRALGLALAAKIGGSLIRFYFLQSVYGEGDAFRYDQAGLAHFESVRSLDFSFIQGGSLGTSFLEDFASFLYAVIGPTLLGSFLICSVLAFIGTWYFYRAHRIAFPDGDSRLYFLLMFFLPTMIFWPSELGKDALMIFGLGMGVFGLARLLQGFSGGAFALFVFGTGVAFLVRPPVGVMLLAGAALALLIHPGKMRTLLGGPITWMLMLPILAGAVFLAGRAAAAFEELDSLQGTVAAYETTANRLETGGSQFQTGLPSSPSEAARGLATVLVRPLPWELSNPLAAFAGLEGLVFGFLIIFRFPQAVRSLRLWRGGMIVASIVVTLSLIIPLTAFSNFGLLVRQRAQLLPFLFMIFTAVRKQRRRAPQPAPPPPAFPTARLPAAPTPV